MQEKKALSSRGLHLGQGPVCPPPDVTWPSRLSQCSNELPPGKAAPPSARAMDRDTAAGLSVLSQEPGRLRLARGPRIQPPSCGHLPTSLAIPDAGATKFRQMKREEKCPNWPHKDWARSSLYLSLDVDAVESAAFTSLLQGKSQMIARPCQARPRTSGLLTRERRNLPLMPWEGGL